MAGAARRAANRRVVHCIGRETCGRVGVAIATLQRSSWDVRRRGQASCGGAVVARRTSASDTGMVERHARKETHRILVASLAGLNGGKMICCFS